MMPKKTPKKRADKYNEKIKAAGSFSTLMKELFPPAKPKKEKPPAKVAKPPKHPRK